MSSKIRETKQPIQVLEDDLNIPPCEVGPAKLNEEPYVLHLIQGLLEGHQMTSLIIGSLGG